MVKNLIGEIKMIEELPLLEQITTGGIWIFVLFVVYKFVVVIAYFTAFYTLIRFVYKLIIRCVEYDKEDICWYRFSEYETDAFVSKKDRGYFLKKLPEIYGNNYINKETIDNLLNKLKENENV